MSDSQSTSERDDVMRQTLAHKTRVGDLMAQCLAELTRRAIHHDDSKFSEREWGGFAEATVRLKALTYGSDEYKAALADLKPTLEHHYATNSHHPEHFNLWKCPLCIGVFPDVAPSTCYGTTERPTRLCPSCCRHGSIMEATLEPHVGIEGMNLLDALEMLCDWKAATERHADGSIARSFDINRERFGITPQLEAVLKNTARSLGWMD